MKRLRRLPARIYFYRADEYEMDARLDYKFVLNDKEWIFDPLNPRRITGGFGPNSYFAMPDYAPPPESSRGRVCVTARSRNFSFASRILNNERAAKVYLAVGICRIAGALQDAVRAGRSRLPESREDQRDRGRDDSTTTKFRRFVMVLVPPVDRDKEYWANADFARAFATELVPAIDAKYRTKPDAASRAVMGSSLGGLISIILDRAISAGVRELRGAIERRVRRYGSREA